MKSTRRSGFTLVEISVVLVIALIISSITFGAFRSVSDGNKRTNCQSNLSQIYQSTRLYAQDYSGEYPYFNPDDLATNPGANKGLGLWALYTYRDKGADDCLNAPYDPNLPPADSEPNTLTGYVRSSKIFHCPSDDYKKTVNYRSSPTACATADVSSSQPTFTVGGVLRRNTSYLSYQNGADIDPALSIPPHHTYSSYRGSGEKRQLDYYVGTTTSERPVADLTVVTWCRFHRSLNSAGATNGAGKRNYDNVLFSDGSVQNLPAVQEVKEPDPSTDKGKCLGWQRVPRGKADFMKDATTCTP